MVMRTFTILLLMVIGILPSAAGPRDDTFAEISRCAVIQDDRMLLDCIYGAAQPLRSELGLAPAPSFQTKLVPLQEQALEAFPPASDIRPLTKESFLQRLMGEDPISETKVRVASYTFDRRGLFTITLSNGEIWGQLTGDKSRQHWHWSAQDHYVSVQGDTSSATMEISDETGIFKVQRLH